MFTEIAIFTTLYTTYGITKYKMNHHAAKKIIKKWDLTMKGAGIKNKEDEESSYKILHIYRKAYGFSCVVSVPYGFNYSKVEGLKDIIEKSLACKCELNDVDYSDCLSMKLITNPQNDINFSPIPTKAYEILIANDYTGTPKLLNMNKFSHLLIGGVTGSGKSREVLIILTNLIYNHTKNEIGIFISQIEKIDMRNFRYYEQVIQYTTRLDESLEMFSRIVNIINKRSNDCLMTNSDNIEDYNLTHKNKMKYLYVFSDEFSFFMPSDVDTEDDREIKAKCLYLLIRIILTGRWLGVNVIISLQRTTVDNIPSTLKSQMTRLSFRQIGAINSNNIIETSEATKLKTRECILLSDDYYYLKTPYIDKSLIKKTLKDREILTEPITVKTDSKNHGGWHIPTPEEWEKTKGNIPTITTMILRKAVEEVTGQLPPSTVKHPKMKGISLKEVGKI